MAMLMLAAVNLLRFSRRLGSSSSNRPMATPPVSATERSETAFPTQVSQWPIAIANLFFAPAIGLFYFLILQGVAQGLNLGLDIFYELQPEDTVEDKE